MQHTLRSSSVGFTLFFSVSIIVITLVAGSFSAIAFCKAFTRESSSRWSMIAGNGRGGVVREG